MRIIFNYISSSFFKLTRKECYCGQSYGKYGSAAPNSCSLTCPVTPYEICGGVRASSVYKINHNYVTP
jgi:hypothetical protein